MPPATQSMTSVNEVRAIDLVYSAPRVVASARGRSESTDQTVRLHFIHEGPRNPRGGERITNPTLPLHLLGLALEAILEAEANTRMSGGGLLTPSSCTSRTTPMISRQSSVVPTRICLPSRAGRVVPVLFRQVLRDEGHRPLLVGISPGEIAAGQQRRSHGGEKPGRDEFEAANRRKLARLVGVVLGEDRDRCEPYPSKGMVGAEADRGDAGNGGEFVRDLLLEADHLFALGVGNARLGNVEVKRLQRFRGSAKPGDTCIKARKVWIIKPEQISRTRARATCTTTSALRARWRSRPWLEASSAFAQVFMQGRAGVLDDWNQSQ